MKIGQGGVAGECAVKMWISKSVKPLFIYLSLIDAVFAVVTHPFKYTLPPWIKYFHVKSIGGPIFGFFADLWCAQSGWSLLRSWLLSLHTLGDNGTMSFTPPPLFFFAPSLKYIHQPLQPVLSPAPNHSSPVRHTLTQDEKFLAVFKSWLFSDFENLYKKQTNKTTIPPNVLIY